MAVGLIWSIHLGSFFHRPGIVAVESSSLEIDATADALATSGGRVSGTFVLANYGAEPAYISQIVPNCSCASVTVAGGRRIPAGATAKLVVEIDLQGNPSREARILLTLKNALPQQFVLRLLARRTT